MSARAAAGWALLGLVAGGSELCSNNNAINVDLCTLTCTAGVDCDYHLEPSWAETVARYQEAHRVRDEHVHTRAFTEMIYTAFFTGLGVLCLFLLTTLGIFAFGDKEMSQLHDYIESHMQDADHVDKVSGAKAILEAKAAAMERTGVGKESDEALQDNVGGRIEGRFAHVSGVQEVQHDSLSMKERMNKHRQHDAHVKSMIERAFEAIDVDGSGELNKEELTRLLKTMGEECGDDEMDKVMAKFDPDSSGSVTFAEFRDGWHDDSKLKHAGAISAKGSRSSMADNLNSAEVDQDSQADRIVEASKKNFKKKRKGTDAE